MRRRRELCHSRVLGFYNLRLNAHRIERKIMELLFRLYISPSPAHHLPASFLRNNEIMIWKKLYNSLSSFVNGNNFTKQIFSHFEGIKSGSNSAAITHCWVCCEESLLCSPFYHFFVCSALFSSERRTFLRNNQKHNQIIKYARNLHATFI